MNARTPADAEDYLYAFFQNCYHLRDWLLGTYSQDAIDEFLKSALPLRTCRDVANLPKQFALSRTPAQGHEPSVLREYAGANMGWFEDDTRLVIVTNHNDNGIVLDAREVARECMRLWCEFLPDCDVVRDVRSHFQFSEKAFKQVLSKAEGISLWAKDVVEKEFHK